MTVPTGAGGARIPLVASVAWESNKLDGGIKSTNGHLMVIGGFMGNGDVIAYDPASPDNQAVRHVYDRRQFEKAWIPASGGIVYVARPADWPGLPDATTTFPATMDIDYVRVYRKQFTTPVDTPPPPPFGKP